MKILIIDDEVSLLKLLKLSLAKPDVSVLTAETAQKAVEIFKTDIFDVVLCDIGLPDKDGLQVLQELKTIHSETPVIMITAHGSIQDRKSVV